MRVLALEWLRISGEKQAACTHRAISSGVVSAPKPPMSVPTNGIPDSPKLHSCGISICKCAHRLGLSPVHAVAYFCEPAKQARVMTNGRRPSSSFNPS